MLCYINLHFTYLLTYLLNTSMTSNVAMKWPGGKGG